MDPGHELWTRRSVAAGSIAAYPTEADAPELSFWPPVFKNIRVFFLGSDDFRQTQRRQPRALNEALLAAWEVSRSRNECRCRTSPPRTNAWSVPCEPEA